ncbi:MAG TPA: hypothetical protein DCL86_08285 [Bacteroidales bacterium]|nr:hypothetical protein [Bacteroidales bacterium]
MDEINFKPMKIKTLPLLLSLLMFNAVVQAQPCNTAIPEHLFRQKMRSVDLQSADESRLQVGVTIVKQYCLSAEQVAAIAGLFYDDAFRLQFAESAWLNTVDKENFYIVYDAFAHFSAVFMLHDYVQEMKRHSHDYLPPVEPPLNLNFPALNYPVWEVYQGPTNCEQPMGEFEFNDLARQLASTGNESGRQSRLSRIAQNHCMSAAQAVKFASLLKSEPNRLDFFREAIYSVYDLQNLAFGATLFSHIPNKGAYNNIISQIRPPQPPPPCQLNPDDFTQIIRTIRKESFNNTKLKLAKQIVQAKHCFTVNQIKEIIVLFDFDETRLELAEFAWEYTLDRENYYQVADAFSFNQTREKLMKFLEKK